MKNLNRRQFIQSGLTASGGMLLSFHLPALAKFKPYEPNEVSPELNAWLAIEPDDTITIRVAQSEMGEGVFTSLPMIIAEELEVDWRKVRAEYADANRSLKENKVYARMATGGSRAVRHSREYLQMAGAQARAKLIKAAAELWSVDPKECRADYGSVYHDKSRKSVNYGAIAGTAAQLKVANVKIKTPEQFGLIGLPKKRLDVPAKVNGSAIYGMDVRVPGMLYAAVVHCPVIGGKLRNLKFNAIREMPGVHKAVRMESSVAVIADYYWQAKTAVEKLPVEWEIGKEGEEGKSYSDNWKADYISVLGREGTLVTEKGNAVKAMELSETTIASDYILPYLSHACMEPLNCTVHIQDKRVDVWAGVQNPESALRVAAEVSGIAEENVYVHNCFLGGGFGRRSNPDFVKEAVLIAKEIGKPVQMIWSREEDQRQGQYRPMAAIRFKAGFDIDNKLVSYMNHSVTHSILAGLNPKSVKNGIDRSSVEGLGNMPYRVANKKITHTIKNTHMTTWFWRSVGNSQNAFARECFVDEMAEASKSDPLQFRLDHLRGHPEMLNVLDVLARKAKWGKSMKRGFAQGLAIHESFGTICAQVAEVGIDEKGKVNVHKVISVVDCGNLINPLTAEEQVESSIIFGLTAALYGKLTVENGRINEVNFDTYEMMKMKDTPLMETHFALSGGDKWGGMGEPATPPIAPAVCNAVSKITGKRTRALPLVDYFFTVA